MRYLEVRRHAERFKPGDHLNQNGVNMARRVGDTMGHFDHVGASTIIRAIETAIAMGYAVEVEYPELAMIEPGVEDEVFWDAGFAAFARGARKGGATARFVERMAAFWRSVAENLADGESALLITHGGLIEAGVVGVLPDADHVAWGGYCGYCEGVRVAFDGEKFVDIEVLRVREG